MTFPILPRQREIYEALISGRHLCLDDGDLYGPLRDREEDFRLLFEGLGMNLVTDPRGFFYLDGTRTPSNMKDILFFMAILFEHLDEQGYGLDDALFRQIFCFADLPHLRHQRYAEVMERAAGIKTLDGLKQVVGAMARYRFVLMEGTENFRFRTPAFRLFDLIRDAKNVMDQSANTANEWDESVEFQACGEEA